MDGAERIKGNLQINSILQFPQTSYDGCKETKKRKKVFESEKQIFLRGSNTKKLK